MNGVGANDLTVIHDVDSTPESRREIEDALIELREISHGIYPTGLARAGLSRAFHWLARRYQSKVVVSEATVGRCSPEIELALYYCGLEAVQNASKHAGPEARIWIRLYAVADRLHLEVRDNGRGFDVARARDGVGRQNMHDRLGAIGGRVAVISKPGQGGRIGKAPHSWAFHARTALRAVSRMAPGRHRLRVRPA